MRADQPDRALERDSSPPCRRAQDHRDLHGGQDHIDINAAARAGIVVTNTPDVLTESTADIAMLCQLARAAGRTNPRPCCARANGGLVPERVLGRGLQGRAIVIVGMAASAAPSRPAP
jgi:lactate dehydrogenase-like 2-hydroxyacid dehydrogenase